VGKEGRKEEVKRGIQRGFEGLLIARVVATSAYRRLSANTINSSRSEVSAHSLIRVPPPLIATVLIIVVILGSVPLAISY
jgi:hypothetical protein